MDRKEEILKLFDNIKGKELLLPSIEEMLSLESKLTKYKKVLDSTPINSKNKEKYRFYHSLYKDNLNLYTQIIKTLSKVIGTSAEGKDTVLRAYFKTYQGDK